MQPSRNLTSKVAAGAWHCPVASRGWAAVCARSQLIPAGDAELLAVGLSKILSYKLVLPADI